MARSIILVLVFLSISTLSANAFLGFGAGGKSGNQSGSKNTTGNTTGNTPINTKPSIIECFEKGCAGGPTQVTKPNGTVIWTCSHCPDGNSCNDDTNCAAPTKCNSEGVCTEGKEETGCPLTPEEELAYIKEAAQKAYDDLVSAGYSPCEGNIGNIRSTITGGNVTSKKCDVINSLGHEELVEECLKLPTSKTCNFRLNMGYAENKIGLGHQFICVVDASAPVKPGEEPVCVYTIDFWASCKAKPKPQPVKDFGWEILNSDL
jgi:hypothetical protein